jgi:four helix bundle protein
MANRKPDRPRLTHYDLEAWQEVMRLARDVYALTRDLPLDERWGLASQMRRVAVSIASNIAEGALRSRGAEFKRHLIVTRGSLIELDTQPWLARDLRLCQASSEGLDKSIQDLPAHVESGGDSSTWMARRGLREGLDKSILDLPAHAASGACPIAASRNQSLTRLFRVPVIHGRRNLRINQRFLRPGGRGVRTRLREINRLRDCFACRPAMAGGTS